MADKVDFSKGIKIIISPTENGYACGIINEPTESTDFKNDGLYLCHVIAQGMIKFSMENPSKSDFLNKFSPIFGHRRRLWVN